MIAVFQRGYKLYDFDRLAIFMSAKPTAHDIADEAQRFGQEDDISVLSVVRMTNTKTAIA